MKINYMSDLHLEFDDSFRVTNESNADILCLVGDIFVAADLLRPPQSTKYSTGLAIKEFLKEASALYTHVILIMGNHEHYHGILSETPKLIKATIEDLKLTNVHLLDKEYIVIDDYLFFGSTLWTDFNKNSYLSMYTAEHTMNDYRQITRNAKDYRKITSEIILQEHVSTKEKLTEALALGLPTIVLSHHAPSPESVHPHYKDDLIMNTLYHSDLELFIANHPNILIWFHGHTHSTFDYYIEGTRVLANPKGYYDENPTFDKNKVVELS